jgi:hypothetical protein|tara:strand:+ start:255 stop:677 length:423 start_codon:yes stop_codon:yes gene_type:complete
MIKKFQKLKTKTQKKRILSKYDQDSKGTTCSICLISDLDKYISCHPNCCNHEFHLPCLQTWSNVENICPLCKETFTSIHKLQINLQPIEIKVAPKPKSVKSEDPDDFEESDYMDLVTLIELEDMFTCTLCQNDQEFEFED